MKNREIPQEEQDKYLRDLMAYASQRSLSKALQREKDKETSTPLKPEPPQQQ